MLPSFRGAAFRRIPKWDTTQASYARQKELRGTNLHENLSTFTSSRPKSDRPDYKVRLVYMLPVERIHKVS